MTGVAAGSSRTLVETGNRISCASMVRRRLLRTHGRRGWESFVPFRTLPNVNWHDPNLRFVDLTGDGHADMLISEDDVFTWYQSLGETGFARVKAHAQSLDDERGPRLVFADGEQSIYLADMSGDGLTDIVRIRNSEVCYWPNLGYGRFGAKVTMDHAPWFDSPDQFDQRRIRLADVDGSGLIDIMYLGRERSPSISTGPAMAGARPSCSARSSRRTTSRRYRRWICSATAPRVWSGRRRCRATPPRRCDTST